MAGFCSQPQPEDGLVTGLLGSVDCNVRTLSETAYSALAQPGSPTAMVLTTLLTLYIAFIGFGLLTGRTPLRVSHLTLSVLKIGIVLALATNWPTYQQLVFRTLFEGPQEIGAGMLRTMQPSGSDVGADIFGALQLAYDELQASATFFNQRVTAMASPLTGGSAGAALALNLSALLLLLTSLGVVLAAKIALGLLLGLGPLFVALLLFDATRGVFEGWLRASLAFALLPLAAILGLVVQLTMIEPQLALLAEQRALGVADFGTANAVFLLVLISSGVMAALIVAVGVIAFSLKLFHPAAPVTAGQGAGEAPVNQTVLNTRSDIPAQPSEPRVAAVAAAALAMDRRESQTVNGQTDGERTRMRIDRAAEATLSAAVAPFGQTYRRASGPGYAVSMRRRDR